MEEFFKALEEVMPPRRSGQMKIFLVKQRAKIDHEVYNQMVVVSEDVESARRMCPMISGKWDDENEHWVYTSEFGDSKYEDAPWADHINDVDVVYIGEAVNSIPQACVVCKE